MPQLPSQFPPSRAVSVTIAFCFLAALCEGFDIQAAGVAAGGISRELQPLPAQLGFFFSAGSFGLLLGAIAGGWLADRIGRRKVLIAAIGSFGVFSLLTSLAQSMEALTWMRLLTGFGLGGAMPNLIAITADVSRGASRNASIATTYIGMPLGGAIASLLVALAPAEHWRWIFVAGGIAPLLIAAAMLAFMPRPTERASAAAAVEIEPGILRDLFGEQRLRATLLLWVGFFLLVLTLHLMLNWLPLLLQGRGLTKTAAALAQGGFNLGGAVGGLSIGMALDSRWRRPGIVACIVALPLVLVLLANTETHIGVMIGLALLLGAAILALQVILYGVAGALYPSSVRGTGMGAAVGIGRIGSIVGPAMAALMIGAGRTPTQVLTGLLPIAILCAICVVVLAWPRRDDSG